MKKKLFYSLAIGLILLLLAVGCAQPAATPSPAKPAPAPSSAAPAPAPSPSSVAPAPATSKPAPAAVKPIELKIATYNPPNSTEDKGAHVMGDRIEKETNGKVKFTYYPAETLTKSANQYEATLSGIGDIFYATVPGYTPGRFPLSEIMDLPPAFDNAVDASKFYWDFYQKSLTDEWKAVKVLFVYHQFGWSMHTAKKPVRTFDDIKGLKIRTYGRSVDIVKAFGAVPVAMAASDVYVSAQKGVIDGSSFPFTVMKTLKLAEVFKYHTKMYIANSPFFQIMNLNAYNSLPPDVKSVFDKIGDWMPTEMGKLLDIDQKAGEDFSKEVGGELIPLTPDEQAQWLAKAVLINDGWAKEMEAKGLPGKKLLEQRDALMKQYMKK